MNSSKSENKNLHVSNLINWKSFAIGSLIIFIADFIYSGSYVYYLYYYSGGLNLNEETILLISMLLTVIAGFMVAILNKPTYKHVIVNVVLATIIGIYISNLIIGLMVIFSGYQDSILYYIIIDPILATIFLSVPVGIVGLFGALIGTSIKLKIRN